MTAATTTLKPNAELLLQTLAVVERVAAAGYDEQERSWNQRLWRKRDEEGCGTSFCFAGWSCELDPDVEWVAAFDYDGRVRPVGRVDEGADELPETYAARRLGLTEGQAHQLFYGYNTLPQVQEFVLALTEGRMDADGVVHPGPVGGVA